MGKRNGKDAIGGKGGTSLLVFVFLLVEVVAVLAHLARFFLLFLFFIQIIRNEV